VLLPYLSLDAVLDDPESVRTFLSTLSRISTIGIVESLSPEPGSFIIRAHADPYNFTIVRSHAGTLVVENMGPQAVRLWQRDDPPDISNALESMVSFFGRHVENLSSLQYLYTEHAWFVLRAHPDGYLPKVKRRAFHFADFSTAVLHCRQQDIRGGERLQYVLELPGHMLGYSFSHTENSQGEFEYVIDEDTHEVDRVGF
jgi:hypothetical protein